MSVMRCDGCDNFIDTDFSVEGVWEDEAPFRFWCSRCLETCDDPAMWRALEKQDDITFNELMESKRG